MILSSQTNGFLDAGTQGAEHSAAILRSHGAMSIQLTGKVAGEG